MIEQAAVRCTSCWGLCPSEIESGFRPEQPSYNGSSFGMMQIGEAVLL